ncbi:putative tyramine receptor 2 [Patiria miniata]|uniref:G-protein coupled receptors family 1 profile domain-containing protein n=1 Tax=Patiria miniata TaxID=46514 RepID=A0A913Z9D1_PATMI|nr:putative tyramine receptor 2 [Patiria miniata]
MYLDAVWWFRVSLEGVVFLIGVPGNLLIIHVYASKKSKVTPHVFIIGLAVADFTVCLLRIITLVQLFPPMDKFSASSQFFCRVPPSIDVWPKYTSILLTSAVAVDRYLAICRPHGRRMTVRRARHAVYACFAVSAVFTLSYLFIYGVTPLKDGTTACQFVVPHAVITAEFILLMISFLASLVMIVVLYAKIYRTVNRMAKVRPGNTVHRGALHGLSRVNRDDSTARAEGITPNQLITVVSRKTNPEIQQDTSVDELEAQVKPHQPQPEPRTSTDPVRTKLAWNADHQIEELPILKPPTEATVPSTSSTITRHNTSLASPSSQATNEATGTESDQSNAPQFHKKTTLMLLLSTIVFVVTLLPVCIVLIAYPLILPLLHIEAFRFLVNVASYLNLVNNAANPVLFSFVNRRFREDMKRSLRKLSRGGCRFRD